MADSKINITELSATIASQSDRKTGEVKKFLISLNGIIREALKADEIVRISGLGTFKVVTTEPRRSIDVNTGAEITIGSYKKITFTPEQSVKQAINAEMADLPTIDVDDDFVLPSDDEDDINVARLLGLDAGDGQSGSEEQPLHIASEDTIDQIKSLLAEINGPSALASAAPETTDTNAPDVTPDAPDTPDIPATPEIPNTPETPETPETPATQETSEVPEIPDTPETPHKTTTEQVGVDEQQQIKQQQKKPTPLWKIALILIAAFAVVFGAFYVLLIHHIEKWTEQYVSPAQQQIDSVYSRSLQQRDAQEAAAQDPIAPKAEDAEAASENTEPSTAKSERTEPSPNAEERTEPSPAATSEAKKTALPITLLQAENIVAGAQTRTTEKVIEGSRLAQISRRHYKHPDFWVYIYLANKEKFPRGSNSVVVGTELRIPDLSAPIVDPGSAASVEAARTIIKQLP